MPGVRHRYVRAGGVRLHLAEAGQGAALLLLHGWPQHWWCWRHLIPRLARHYRVLVPDLRGWGWSDAPPGDYAKSTFAADVLALLDAEGLERVKLIGHDWGGYAGFILALDHPERVERFVSLDTPPPRLGPPRLRHAGLPLFASYQVLVGSPLLGPLTMTSGPRFIRGVIRLGSGSRIQWPDHELDMYADVLRDPARARASSSCYRTFLTREVPSSVLARDRVDELSVPTLVLMGESSPVRRVLDPRPSRNLRVEHISGAGHFLPEEAPEEVLELAGPFLDG